MKKVKALALVAIFAGSMMSAPTAEAKHHSGNYVDSNGCLHVWSYDTALFGLVSYNHQEDIFCGVTVP